MIKKIAPSLSLIIGISAVTLNTSNAQAYDITIYSVSHNRSGRVIKTSVGKFYVGKSGDVIHEASSYRRYGFWRQEYSVLRLYIDDNIYKFYL